MPSPKTKRAARALLAAALWLALPAAAGAQDAGEAVMWSDVEVEFEGTRAFRPEQLKGALSRCVAGYFAERYSAGHRGLEDKPFALTSLEHILRRDVVNFMRQSGYVRARLGELRRQRFGRTLSITVPVEEGEFYRLGAVRIEGARHFTAARLREYLPLKRGDVADGPAVGRWLYEHLERLYGDSGFIQYDYEIEPEFVIEPGADEGVVNFRVLINEGPQFRVRKIAFVGHSPTPEAALREALGIGEGEVFGRQKLRDGLGRINDLVDAGDGVDFQRGVDFVTDEEAGELELTIRLGERP